MTRTYILTGGRKDPHVLKRAHPIWVRVHDLGDFCAPGFVVWKYFFTRALDVGRANLRSATDV